MRGSALPLCAAALLLSAAAAVLASSPELMSPLPALAVLSIAIHEAAHIAVGRLSGMRVTGLGIEAGGLVIERRGISSHIGDALTAAAGPAANIVLCLLSAAVGRRFCAVWLYRLSGMNAVLALFNLLPALPLDGGRILFALMSMRLSHFLTARISCILSCAVIFTLLVFGLFCLRSSGTPVPMLAALWLLFAYCKEGRNNIE